MTTQQQKVIDDFIRNPVEPLPDNVKTVLSQPGVRDYVMREIRGTEFQIGNDGFSQKLYSNC